VGFVDEGDLGTICTGVRASMLTTSGEAPLDAMSPLVLTVSARLGSNMVSRINF